MGVPVMKFKVYIMESERGWGQRVDEVKIFDSSTYDGDSDKALAEAKKFVKEFNADNNLPDVPDWYMYATEPVMV
jgi:hypothetical protein